MEGEKEGVKKVGKKVMEEIRTRTGEKELEGATEKDRWEFERGKGKRIKKHLRSSALKLFHLMVLRGIDGQREEAQEGKKREKGKIK